MDKENQVRKSTNSLYRGTPPESALNLAGFMVYKTAQCVQENFDSFFASVPLTTRHFLVLRILFTEGALSQQQLCDGLWIDRGTMVGVVQALLDQDLLKKRENPQDKRSHLISLTAKGEKFYLKHQEAFEALERKIFAGLDAEEFKQLKTLLRKVMAQLSSSQAP